MKQLIARIDDDLHRRLKERSAAEGRSMNAVVISILAAALEGQDARTLLRARLRAEGRLYEPPRPRRVPTWEEVLEAGRGAGTAVSEALEAERRGR